MTTYQLTTPRDRNRSGEPRHSIAAQPATGRTRFLALKLSTAPSRIEDVLAWIEDTRDEETPPATAIFAELGLARLIFESATQ